MYWGNVIGLEYSIISLNKKTFSRSSVAFQMAQIMQLLHTIVVDKTVPALFAFHSVEHLNAT